MSFKDDDGKVHQSKGSAGVSEDKRKYVGHKEVYHSSDPRRGDAGGRPFDETVYTDAGLVEFDYKEIATGNQNFVAIFENGNIETNTYLGKEKKELPEVWGHLDKKTQAKVLEAVAAIKGNKLLNDEQKAETFDALSSTMTGLLVASGGKLRPEEDFKTIQQQAQKAINASKGATR